MHWLSTSDAYVYTLLVDCNYHGQLLAMLGQLCKCYGKQTQ